MATGDDLHLPLEQEIGYIQKADALYGGILGGGGGGGGGGSAVPQQAYIPNLTAQDLNNLMTNFLRTDGQFLANMRGQNQSGLYNSNTRLLLQNDLLSQAALKATEGNLKIADVNARIAAANRSGGGGGGRDPAAERKKARQQLLLALGIAGARSDFGKAAWGDAKEWWSGLGKDPVIGQEGYQDPNVYTKALPEDLTYAQEAQSTADLSKYVDGSLGTSILEAPYGMDPFTGLGIDPASIGMSGDPLAGIDFGAGGVDAYVSNLPDAGGYDFFTDGGMDYSAWDPSAAAEFF